MSSPGLVDGSGRASRPPSSSSAPQKAGTTYLYQEVCKHPAVLPALTKEIHYFCDHYARGASWYAGFFPRRTTGSVTGEASPSYLFHPFAAARIAADLPDVRAVVLLRDPVRRAFSQYQHEVRLGYEDAPTFREALDREDQRTGREWERQLADPFYVSPALRHHAYRARGMYLPQVRRFVDLLGRDRVLVLRSEDLYADPIGEVGRTLDFLGLHGWQPTTPGHNDMASGDRHLPDDVRQDLIEHYAVPNAELAAYLGIDLAWQ